MTAIVLATTTGGPGGVLRHILDLGRALRAQAIESTIELADTSSPAASVAREAGFAVAGLGQTGDVDVWHLHLADTYDRAALRVQLEKRVGRRRERVVLTEHLPRSEASDPTLASRQPRAGATASKTAFKRMQYAAADAVISVSEGSRRFLLDRYRLRQERVICVPNGVVVNVDRTGRLSDPADRVRCLGVGSLIVQKGFDLLLEAAAFAAVPWDVRVVGEGPHREELSVRAVRATEVNPLVQVNFIGWSDDVPRETLQADVVILPSRWESAPYAVLDAMAAGRAVVAFDVDGVHDAVEDGVSGRLIPRGDIRAFARAIDEVLDRSVCEAWGQAAKRRVAKHFALDTMVERTLAVYSSP